MKTKILHLMLLVFLPLSAFAAVVAPSSPTAAGAAETAVSASAATSPVAPASAPAPAPIQPANSAPADVAPQASSKVKAQAWQIIPAESSIQFVGTLNDAPVVGKFTRFTGDINFDPQALGSSHVLMVIDITSVSTSYRDIEDTLKAGDWLAMNMFPTAKFEANNFQYIKDGQFRASGNLTIRDKTLPMTLDFSTTPSADQSKQTVTGTGKLNRSAFGLGRGEWAATGNVGEEVTVNFSLVAKKK